MQEAEGEERAGRIQRSGQKEIKGKHIKGRGAEKEREMFNTSEGLFWGEGVKERCGESR